jgi:hypothetical protein
VGLHRLRREKMTSDEVMKGGLWMKNERRRKRREIEGKG